MKKSVLTAFAVICAICIMFGVMTTTNVNKASANSIVEDGEIPVLSETKYKLSTNKGGLLIATAIKNYSDVYEVGYTGLDDAVKLNSSTTKYYASIRSGSNEWTAQNLFGNEFEGAGLIVWEIVYDNTVDYTYRAYAKYGQRIDGNLSPYNPERIVTGTAKTTSAEIFEREIRGTKKWSDCRIAAGKFTVIQSPTQEKGFADQALQFVAERPDYTMELFRMRDLIGGVEYYKSTTFTIYYYVSQITGTGLYINIDNRVFYNLEISLGYHAVTIEVNSVVDFFCLYVDGSTTGTFVVGSVDYVIYSKKT